MSAGRPFSLAAGIMCHEVKLEEKKRTTESTQLMINEAQLVLAEKRTSLAALRTGLALLGLPLAIVSFLIAMSKHYHVDQVWGYLVPVLLICIVLGILGIFVCWRALKNLHKADQHLAVLKKECSVVDSEFV
jgi:uncharacterized membrane protein YidH (DUF202 family)